MPFARSFALLLVLCASGALAASPLQRGEAAFEDLEFEQARKHFQQALAAPGTTEERIRTYRGLGMSLAFLGDAGAAQGMFETLLLLDPAAKVNTSLGPKVGKPFEAARREVQDRKVELRLERDDRSGEISARLSEPMDAASRVVLHVRPEGGEVRKDEVPSPGPARLALDPWVNAEAWAVAEDQGGGTLFTAGTESSPRRLEASARAPSLAMAITPPEDEAQTVEPARRSRWPLWVGGAAVVIGGGVAAAYALRPGEPLQLPAADRTGRLP